MPIAFVPLRPLIQDAWVVVPIPPTIGVFIEFDQAMDQSVIPGNSTFQFLIDGVPKAVTVSGWNSATELSVTYSGSLPTVSAYVSQLILDINCRSVLGTFARPQGYLQWYP